MAALMSVTDNLTSPEPVPQPPNNTSPTSRSPPTTAVNAQQRSASRGSQHSPNGSGVYIFKKRRKGIISLSKNLTNQCNRSAKNSILINQQLIEYKLQIVQYENSRQKLIYKTP